MLDNEQISEVQKYFQCEIEDIEHVEDDTYMVEGQEYVICDDERADSLTADYIENIVWAFNPNFICNCIEGLSHSAMTGLEEMIKNIQVAQCESANDSILKILGNNLEDLIAAAIQCDGRGHFLSSYDADEIEITRDLYAYRQ